MRLTWLLLQRRIIDTIVKHISRGNADLWSLRVASINPLNPSGHYTYRQFNIQQFYVLPTQCFYVFCVDLRTNSDYFPIRH